MAGSDRGSSRRGPPSLASAFSVPRVSAFRVRSLPRPFPAVPFPVVGRERRPYIERGGERGPRIQSLIDRNRDRTSPARFLHILGVTHWAVALAARHGLDPADAAVAALLHDASKETPPDRLAAELAAAGRPLEDDDLALPVAWHGPHAAVVVAREVGADRLPNAEAIAEAVRLHTTGDAGIGPLAKVLFLADSLEPGRDFPGADELRALAHRDLDEAFARTLRLKCESVVRRKPLSPRARRALEFHGIEIAPREEASRV